MSSVTKPSTGSGYSDPRPSAIEPARRTRVVITSVSPASGSVSRALAIELAERLEAAGVGVLFVDRREMSGFLAGEDRCVYPDDVQIYEEAARDADALVFAGPVHRGFVSGAMLESAVLVRAALADRPVLVIGAAGSTRAHGAIEQFRALLWNHYSADVLPAVLASPEVTKAELTVRLDCAAVSLIERMSGVLS